MSSEDNQLSKNNYEALDKLAEKCLESCEKKNWSRTALEAGVFLHLEVSEFIESFRGKGGDPPVEEGGDVLFVLLSILANYGIKPSECIQFLEKKAKIGLEDE